MAPEATSVGESVRAESARDVKPSGERLEDIRASLEEDIICGKLHPRQHLIEDELMARFGVGRYTIRNVLHSLAASGLVVRRKHHSCTVRAFDAQDVRHLYQMRELLETTAAAQIPLPANDGLVAELSDIQRHHDAAVAASDHRSIIRYNRAFHATLFSTLENPYLFQEIERYALQTNSMRFASLAIPNYRVRSQNEHWEIIRCLVDGKRDLLVEICREHLLPSRDVYLNLYT